MKRKGIFLFSGILIALSGFSQSDIIVEDILINNTEKHYGATNSIVSPGTVTKPVSINPGAKTVEYKAGSGIMLMPGFFSNASSTGYYKAYIDPSFNPAPTADPPPNEFVIGMFSFLHDFKDEYGTHPCSTALNPSGFPSSQLNVLKEDGFNTVHQYGWPGMWSGDREHALRSVNLVKNNEMQLAVDGSNYFRPDEIGYTGVNVYDGYDGISYTPPGGPTMVYNYNTWNRAKPNYDDLIENVYSDPELKMTIWGYRLSEEFSHAQFQGRAYYLEDWNPCDPALGKYVDCPVNNVADAVAHFRNKLNITGASHQKLLHMESYHVNAYDVTDGSDGGPHAIMDNSISAFTVGHHDPGQPHQVLCEPAHLRDYYYPEGFIQGYTQPQDYIDPNKVGSNMPDVFFEGTYWYEKVNNSHWPWYKTPYSNIFNNRNHYLGPFKTIDYAYKKGVKEVHKVVTMMSSEGIHSGYGSPNADGLWFYVYNSIIHGAKGIWFYDLPFQYSEPENAALNTYITYTTSAGVYGHPDRFTRQYFPLNYQNYVSNLARELAYLSKKNFLSTDSKNILYSKTAEADPNCILPPASVYVAAYLNDYAFLEPDMTNAHIDQIVNNAEGYGLRYTIRTNGDEVIMIISNPLPIPMGRGFSNNMEGITLNFNQLSNPIIRASSGVDVLFSDNTDCYLPGYNIDRSNNIDLNDLSLLSSDFHYMPFLPNKKLTLTFGPLDVKILRFKVVNPIYTNNTDWEKVWTNDGNNTIDTWHLSKSDIMVAGDFNGDSDDELLCTQQLSAYATLLNYENEDWKTMWSNNGNNAVGSWLIRNSDILVAGDFEGDDKEELLCLQQTSHYSTMLSYNAGTWTDVWSNGGSWYIGSWAFANSDAIVPGDYDGDGKDEIMCIRVGVGGYDARMLKYSAGTWQTIWTNSASGMIDGWHLDETASYMASDINNDGKSDLLCLHGFPSTAVVLQFVPTNNDPVSDPSWKLTNNQLNGLSGWQSDVYGVYAGMTVPQARVLTGNIDYDGKAEIMYVQIPNFMVPPAIAKSAEYVDDNNLQVNWNNSGSQYINDWIIPLGDNYMLLKPNKYNPEYLMTIRGDETSCKPFLINMYRSQDLTNKRIAISESDSISPSSITAADLVDYNSEFMIYPNPNAGSFKLYTSTDAEKHITVYDLAGRIVYELKNVKEKSIDVAIKNVMEGVYFVKITTNESTKTKKIIVQQ